MPRYLDPKSDLVFKKIFGEHPHLLKSFLNAILPLPDDRQIVELEYLPSEQVPTIPEFKRTIVDVKCRDQQGQIFIVENKLADKYHGTFSCNLPTRIISALNHPDISSYSLGFAVEIPIPSLTNAGCIVDKHSVSVIHAKIFDF